MGVYLLRLGINRNDFVEWNSSDSNHARHQTYTANERNTKGNGVEREQCRFGHDWSRIEHPRGGHICVRHDAVLYGHQRHNDQSDVDYKQ